MDSLKNYLQHIIQCHLPRESRFVWRGILEAFQGFGTAEVKLLQIGIYVNSGLHLQDTQNKGLRKKWITENIHVPHTCST